MITGLLHKIVSHPLVYDLVQDAFGRKRSRARLLGFVPDFSGMKVLDAGGGTGYWSCLLPSGAQYLWLDEDPQKLEGLLNRMPQALAALGDATRIPLRNKSVDAAFCMAVAHHLPDELLDTMFRELARTTSRYLLFLDPIVAPQSRVSRKLWQYDRGSFPRTAQALRNQIERYFTIERAEEYTVRHRYLLCLAKPKL